MEKKWIMHYCNSHEILLVGEGDFSFALCLARAFGTATNMVATSRDSRVSLELKYASALRNLTELENLGCTIVHGVDVHSMSQHPLLQCQVFDRIVFNFPHAGFIGRENDYRQIKRHKKLVSGFLRNAKSMLARRGQIHITHKTAYPYSEWEIEELAERGNLILVGEEEFCLGHYPGYINKKGDGRHCDSSFPVGESSTFMFAMGY